MAIIVTIPILAIIAIIAILAIIAIIAMTSGQTASSAAGVSKRRGPNTQTRPTLKISEVLTQA